MVVALLFGFLIYLEDFLPQRRLEHSVEPPELGGVGLEVEEFLVDYSPGAFLFRLVQAVVSGLVMAVDYLLGIFVAEKLHKVLDAFNKLGVLSFGVCSRRVLVSRGLIEG